MNLLAIECTHERLSIALQHEGGIAELQETQWRKAAESIVPLADRVMRMEGLGPSAIDAVAVSSGPGSFTALRIGISTAKGIAYGLSVPLFPVPTLPAMAFSAHDCCDATCIMAVIESRKGEYYHAVYPRAELRSFAWHGEVACGGPASLLSAAASAGGSLAVISRKPHVLAPICEQLGAACLEAGSFSARSLLPAAEWLCASGEKGDPCSVEPGYHQEFVPRKAGG